MTSQMMQPLFGVTPRLLYAPPGRKASLIQRGAQLPTNIRRGHMAGLPNSGTNFGFHFLDQNCVAPDASGTEGPKRNHLEWQVMYTPRALPVQAHRKPAIWCGKHTWLPGLHDASEWYSSASSKSSAVVVMTRHPLWWARSQCHTPWRTKIEKNRGWGRGNPQPPPCPRSLEQHPLSTADDCYNKLQAYLYQQQHNGTAVTRRNLTAARPRFPTLMHYWAAWHTAYASASANASARIFVRYEDLLLQPRLTLQAVCPLLGRVARRTLVKFDKIMSPLGQRNDTIGKNWTSTHNASAVCDVGAAIGPYTASDLRIARETTAHMARLYGYHVP